MNTKKVTNFHRLMVSQSNHYVIMLLAYIFLTMTTPGFTAEAAFWFLWPIFGLILFVFYMGVEQKRKVWMYYAGFIMFLGISMVISNQVSTQVVIAGIGCVYLINALFPEAKTSYLRNNILPIPGLFVIGIICIWILDKRVLIDQQKVFINMFLVALYIYALALFVDKYYKYFRLNKHSIGYAPSKEILLSGLKYIAIVVSLIAGFFVFVANLDVLNKVLDKVRAYMLSLFLLLMRKGGEAPEETIEDVINQNKIQEIIPDDRTVSPVWDLIVYILFGLLVLYLLYKLTKFIFNFLRYARLSDLLPSVTKKEKEEDEEIEIDVVEKIQKKRVSFLPSFSPVERIRRSYKKKVLSSAAAIENDDQGSWMQRYTARECADALRIRRMGEIYEKARYSQYEVTMEDAKEMKEVCKEKGE